MVPLPRVPRRLTMAAYVCTSMGRVAWGARRGGGWTLARRRAWRGETLRARSTRGDLSATPPEPSQVVVGAQLQAPHGESMDGVRDWMALGKVGRRVPRACTLRL